MLSKFFHGVSFLSIFIRQPYLFLQQKKYIFILSHMRSYSTLLAHILGSNVEIQGHSEMFYSYQSWYDLLRLKYKVYIENDRNLSGTYVLDKLLYNSLTIDLETLVKQKTYVIIMIRKPYETIQSIVRLKRNFQNEADFNLHDLVTYYIGRLHGLEIFIEKNHKRTNIFFFESELLIENTNTLLTDLSQWLDLSEKLVPQYSQFENTGQIGKGDPSEFIKTGTIQKLKSQATKRNMIQIPDVLISRANQAYNDFIMTCHKYHIPTCK